jgi:hypothetical protein
MRILIDECLPKKLKYEFQDYEVATVPEMGWAGKKNGELLQLMAGEFDVFVTIDQSIPYQQNLAETGLTFILLSARTNKLEHLKPHMPQVLAILQAHQPGEMMVVKEQE